MARFADTGDSDAGDHETRTEVPRPTISGAATAEELAAGQLSVLVISERAVVTRPLPASGEIRIGRAHESDVQVDDPSISRSHASLTIGRALTLRDLGSANGTRVRDQELRPGDAVEVQPGEVIQLGSATLIVQRRAAQVRVQRLWAHDYFEVRLEEECARGRRDGGQFVVARLRCEPPPSPEALQAALLLEARASAVVGEYGPGEYELLLVGASQETGAAAVARLVQTLEARGATVIRGMACFPRDGVDPDELIHRAAPFVAAAPAADPVVGAAIIADRRMQDLYRLAERLAAGNITVLILGETGVGKEVLAERVHRMSPRSARPYLKLNCAALSETLLESELFGHERGAFTGAVAAKQGLLESADGGTIFLDEIGELPMATQVKLLRVLEERVVTRVGGLKAKPLDVRFIAATNRDLESEIARGTFRQDLYFRLNGATLIIPPLRERPGEIGALARAFVSQAARQMGMTSEPSIAREAIDVLTAYAWPGNIRELRNVMERSVLLCTTGSIVPANLPLEKMRVTLGVGVAGRTPEPTPPPPRAPLPDPLAAEMPTAKSRVVSREAIDRGGLDERERILEALALCAGNQTAAAARLGIARRTLINKLELHGIGRPRKGR